ncbi:condensin complex component cnd2 [Coprinopsis cinerea okayama7|uniref:Condensin complex subunit 2 n=1 Tax=Coprinopsis cinerea (strain Okayama-7 / 130 / ATCC MYA-4618 / FGSC 9003) TaxID=240176 RepID=A8N9X2_COPC7|nr:condensin complex component cnd2 [Coprinopsis cinerea okayama7\|eukprot:XP_001831628.1 condensin complex component cnd2 [Coprinopsis cinerea okayama7\
MAPPRRARSPNGARVHYEENSEGDDSEQETPRLQKSHLKKRLSEAYIPDGDASFTSESGQPGPGGARAPLKSVNINDDEAEKRRRRKSMYPGMLENAVAGPSSEGNQDVSGDSSRTMGRTKQLLTSVASQPVPKVQIDIVSSRFEEWMKMATDNKINAGNSWDFALIDYFHDMSLLRNNDDNSINFQRASCTLDGCVKIWTSRVDSLGTETGKLLSNLASGRNDDDDDENSDNPDGGPTQKKKKSSRSGNHWLVKDYAAIQLQKFDLEFSVDPLFKKTSEDFDEGGARGLLMNHLSLGLGSDGGMRVIFDASDSVFKEDDEVVDEPVDLIDLSELREKFLPDLEVLENKAISHSLAGFTFSKDFDFDSQGNTQQEITTARFDDIDDDNDSDDGPAGGDFHMDVDQNPGAVEDFFETQDGAHDDYAFGGQDMGGDDFGGEGSNGGSVGPVAPGEDGPMGPPMPFDPRKEPNQRELFLAMDGEGDGALDYFDSQFRRNWAGPEHWKLRRLQNANLNSNNAGENKQPKTRTKKEPVKIDFLTPSEKSLKAIKEELFAPVGKGQSINLPGTGPKTRKKKDKKKDDHRLPDDMHFSSRQLVTLFLKPKFFLKMRGRRARMNNDDGEIDENFWAQAAADQARAREGDQDDDGGHVPFSTQFFNDDDDDGPGGFDDPYGEIGPSVIDAGEQDLLAATQGQTRRIKPEAINYAKRAKRVDVRKLKENIWNHLDIVVPKSKPEDGMDVDDDENEKDKRPPTDPNEARQFSQVVTGLKNSYPADKLEEISTSFCFICLLHLANEQGLKLETASGNGDGDDMPVDSIIPDDDDDEIAAGKPGNDLWSIKIYRDPNATQSA